MNKLLAFVCTTILFISGCGGERSSDTSSATPSSNVTYTINSTSSPTNSGVISGLGSYSQDANVTIVANPITGYTFVNWTEAGTEVSTNNSYTFKVGSNRDFVANFMLNSYSINATSNLVGGGSVSGSGNYNHGVNIVLLATPNAGYTFVNWTEGGVVISSSNNYTFLASNNHSLIANFIPNSELLNGSYEGAMKSPLAIWGVDAETTVVDILGANISLTQQHFGGATCIFTGLITDVTTVPLSASGSYQCSDFTSGTWSSIKIAKTARDALIAELTVNAAAGIYTAKYNGFLKEASVPAIYSSGLKYNFDSGNYLNIGGVYSGYLKSADQCAVHTFEVSSSDTTISIIGSTLNITQNSFFEGTCNFTGTIVDIAALPLSANGTYQCSNFDQGTWSSSDIVMTGIDSFIAELTVDVPNRACSYGVKYSGFK